MGTRVARPAFSTTEHTWINLDAGLIATCADPKDSDRAYADRIAGRTIALHIDWQKRVHQESWRSGHGLRSAASTATWAGPHQRAHPTATYGTEYFDIISQTVVNSWSRGRIFGDAAWCSTLFAGSAPPLGVAGARLRDLPLRFPPASTLLQRRLRLKA
jgi:hypothetical protein